MDIPAVSIIIPMYNAEKYISECLDSILAQTFSDYEVIVVDDASTDTSRDIVESYLPKFTRGGVERLRLICSEESSGGAGYARNVGLKFSCGKYVLFVDSDDAITETALEEIFTTAEKFQVDVMQCEKYYFAPGDTVTTDKNYLEISYKKNVLQITKPTFLSDSLEERIVDFVKRETMWNPWSYFIRRDFLIENDIKFPTTRVAVDFVFSFFVRCLSKKFLCAPNVFYVWRQRSDSLCHALRESEDWFHYWGDAFFRGASILDDFMNRFDFFLQHKEYKYAVHDIYIRATADHNIFSIYVNLSINQIDDLMNHELSKVPDKTALTKLLFSRMYLFKLQLVQAQKIISQQQNEFAELQRHLKNILNNEVVF